MMGVSLIVNIKTIVRNYLLPALLCLVVASCGAPPAAPTLLPTDIPPTLELAPTSVTAGPTIPITALPRVPGPTRTTDWYTPPPGAPTGTPYNLLPCQGDVICIHWYVGLGSGTEPEKIVTEEKVVNGLNAFQDKIEFNLIVMPFAAAQDALATMIAAGNAPDIIGPFGLYNANLFHGEWLDLKEYIVAHPESVADIDPALMALLDSAEGQTGLPVSVYPSAIFYNTALFDKAGLAYPPSEYGPNLGPATYQLDGKQVPWDWDTIREVARRLTLDANGHNATQAGFDPAHIVQYGFSWNYDSWPAEVGNYWTAGSYLAANGRDAQIPDGWREAWEWTYAGMWGDQPWMPTGPFTQTYDYNDFNNGKAAMTVQPVWLTCCLEKLSTWDLGVLPSYQGKVSGRMDVDFMTVLKGTRHPQEAFQVLAYLLNRDELFIGSEDTPAVYGSGIPGRTSLQPAWLAARRAAFPWVKHWDIFFADLNFPDIPSANAWMPNFSYAAARSRAFYDLMATADHLDLDKEIAMLKADLQAIFDRTR